MSRPDELLRVTNLKVYFAQSRGVILKRNTGTVRAVDDVSFSVFRGETLGVVGESGSGKTTLGRAILQLRRPTSGSVTFEGVELTKLRGNALRRLRRQTQMIFQDPYASLNPRMTVGQILAEPIRLHKLAMGQAVGERVDELLGLVGLSTKFAHRYPHQFSGGQRQRVGIARALAVNPTFLVCDEPVSALDVSIRAQLINLLEDLQHRLDLTYLFIAHDLSVVRHISNRVAVMYLGKLVEVAGSDDLYEEPLHPYTQALLSAVPVPDPQIERLRKRLPVTGDIPSAFNPPSGCHFRTRCPYAQQLCSEEEPPLIEARSGHTVACHFWEQISAARSAVSVKEVS
jgi:oligopeptide transport system ATP-binding protein